jgi:hypothetical protein
MTRRDQAVAAGRRARELPGQPATSHRTMRRPSFFIVGAPKCGTTALYSYLRQHEEIFLPHKEIHYFGGDLEFRYRRRLSEREYVQLFESATVERRLGDASVWYLFSKRAASEIHDFDPDARIIVMLRNPVDVMYSLHSQMLYAGDEDLPSFAAALEAEEERRAGRRIPRGARLPQALLYHDVASFTEQVQRYFDSFGRAAVHVILYDDFKRDTDAVYRSTLRFLGVDPDHRVELEVVNPNTVRRSRWLARHLAVPYPTLRKVVRLALPVPGWRRALGREVSRINTVRRTRTAMDSSLQRRLTEELVEEVRALESLIGRDLSAWCRVQP